MRARPAERLATTEREPKHYAALHKLNFPALKLQRILVPLDFSQFSLHALSQALAVAEQFGARIILLHVVEPAVYPENHMAGAVPLDQGNQVLLEAARERLEEIRRQHIGSKIPTEALVRIGHPYSEIPDTAKAMGADLIVIATHGYTGLKHVLLGSVAERVVRHASCPVLTVRNPE